MSKLELRAADPATVEDDLSNADEAHPHAEAHQPACDGKSSNPGHCDLARLLYISYLLLLFLLHVFNFVFVFGILYIFYLPVLESQVIQDIATSRLYFVTYGSLL